MVGDKPEKDIAGAKLVGMRTAFAKYRAECEDRCVLNSGADYDLEDIKDLVGIVQ